MRTETVEISGHLMDSGVLSRVLDDIREYDGDYVIDRFEVGHDAGDISHAQISVSAEDDEALQRLLMRLQTRGVNQVDPGQAEVSVAEQDGVFPDGFYSSTNLETEVRLDGTWILVDNPEMDCGLIVDDADEQVRVHTLPMADVRAGMKVVCGASGIKVLVPISTRFSVAETVEAAWDYARRTRRRVSIEYAMMRGINDQAWRADLLADVLLSYGDWGWVHVNLIPLNPTPGSKWTASDPADEKEFVRRLEAKGIPTTVRDTRGREIDGACGQLAAVEP